VSSAGVLDSIQTWFTDVQNHEKLDIPVAGSAPPAHKFCPQCGAPVQPGKKFCPQCGAKII
jgi:hypothetical protein